MERFWEIDLLRGIAIILMVIIHFFAVLDFYNIYRADMLSEPWWFFGRLAAATFTLLVGVSLTLSYWKTRKSEPNKNLFPKYLKRGLKIFSYGLLITGTTLFLALTMFSGKGTVLFGILHLIGLSIILAYPFIKYKWQSLLLGAAVIMAGLYLYATKITFNFPWLLWLGLKPADFGYRPAIYWTLDYFPMLPWFGVVLIGLFVGNMLYKGDKRKFSLPDLSNYSFVKLLCFLGRHSLFIYLIHLPIFFVVLRLFAH